MSNLNSWEDDPAAQDENLAQQAQQQLNMNPAAAQGGFRPGASSFQPGAASFQPGQAFGGGAYGQYQQQYYQQPQGQPQGFYPQYGAGQGFDQYNQQYQNYGGSGYNQGYSQNVGTFAISTHLNAHR